jgi:hypothetical protein
MSEIGSRDPLRSEPEVIDPVRIRTFATFFRNYMSISTIVVAALPIPVTYFRALPIYPDLSQILTVITPLFCFLILAFVFFIRHGLARLMFIDVVLAQKRSHVTMTMAVVISFIPLILIASSFMLLMEYLQVYFTFRDAGSGPEIHFQRILTLCLWI